MPIVAQSLEPDELVGLPVAMTWMRSSPGFSSTAPPVAEVQPVSDPGPGVLGADVGPVQLMIVLDEGAGELEVPLIVGRNSPGRNHGARPTSCPASLDLPPQRKDPGLLRSPAIQDSRRELKPA